jgi:hypothetical protein
MDIAQVDEIYLNDPDAPEDNAPSSVEVTPYIGLNGDRGTYVIPGLGTPATYDFAESYILGSDGTELFIDPQPFDWFVNMKPTDPDYLTIYQLDKDGEQWNRIIKIIPNTYNVNFIKNFVEGSTSQTVSVPKQALVLEQLFGDIEDVENYEVFRIPTALESVDSVASESAMLALSTATEGDYAFRTDISQFFRLIDTDPTIVGSWQPELSINIDIDIEAAFPATPYPLSNSFQVGQPFSTETTYEFPISVVAAEVQESEDEEPVPVIVEVSGERIIHLTVNVV